MVYTQILHLRNTYLALILPLLCSTWYIMILRNYYQTAVPDSLIEAAMVDGGRQLQIFLRIVVPITTPVTMTVALFQIFAYWNSWYPALLYLDSNHTELYPLQYVSDTLRLFINGVLQPTPTVTAGPPLSVSGTRCTRWTPDSYFRREYAPFPLTRKTHSLKPPSPLSLTLVSSTFQPFASA